VIAATAKARIEQRNRIMTDSPEWTKQTGFARGSKETATGEASAEQVLDHYRASPAVVMELGFCTSPSAWQPTNIALSIPSATSVRTRRVMINLLLARVSGQDGRGRHHPALMS
jgi:hypothetical protein